jgi:predicted nucleotidyltransferase
MPNTIEILKSVFQAHDALEIAVLVGSRADGTAKTNSDWDIALRWTKQTSPVDQLMKTEKLRQDICKQTGLHPDDIDFIDLASAKLAMRALVANEGIVLKGKDSLPWMHFLTYTWGQMEDFAWRQSHGF